MDRRKQSYLQSHGIQEIWGTHDRILVCITPRSNARQMLESGRRNADRFHGELIAVYVRQSHLSVADEAAVEANLEIARELGARIEILDGHDYVGTLIRFAQREDLTSQVLRLARGTQVIIVAERQLSSGIFGGETPNSRNDG